MVKLPKYSPAYALKNPRQHWVYEIPYRGTLCRSYASNCPLPKDTMPQLCKLLSLTNGHHAAALQATIPCQGTPYRSYANDCTLPRDTMQHLCKRMSLTKGHHAASLQTPVPYQWIVSKLIFFNL
jgi:hypothetical protein